MLLTIRAPISGSDLGFLVHKNPARVHLVDLPFGKAHIFYSELAADRSKIALLLEVDPIGLVRGRPQSRGEGLLDQYVNDRPYVSSSLMSVALSRVFGTAMNGRSKERQDIADRALDFEAVITAVPCRGGEPFLRSLFEPLGYSVRVEHHPLDSHFPEWGEGPYYTITLQGRVRLQDLLTHIYVLVPVMDAEKHYWVGDDEVEKLLRKGEGWLAGHPAREAIAARYLRYDRLTRDALARLMEDAPDGDEQENNNLEAELKIEEPLKLWEQRIGAVLSVLRALDAKTIVDLGCGEGKLLKALLAERSFERIVGMDVSWRSLEIAHRRLYLDQMPPAQRKRIELMHGSLMYRDKRLYGFDAAAVIEVIEHLDAARLVAFERVLFQNARPRAVIVTTPNSQYNKLFPTLAEGRMRHKDHRFEWTRQEFGVWAGGVAERFGYNVRFVPVGPENPDAGAPTQMGIFTR